MFPAAGASRRSALAFRGFPVPRGALPAARMRRVLLAWAPPCPGAPGGTRPVSWTAGIPSAVAAPAAAGPGSVLRLQGVSAGSASGV